MLNMPLSEIKQKIQEKTSMSEQELNVKIKEKLSQLSGLISEQGAAHIVANELGVKLVDFSNLKIKNIVAGMRNVDITGKVSQIYDVKEFHSEKRSGKIGSMLLSDETSSMRVVLWNDKADDLQKLKQGDVVKIQSGYVRENNGRKELHLNDVSKILVNPEGVSVATPEVKRKPIKDLAENDDHVELLATIVQVFDPRFYEVCPKCGKRVRNDGSGFLCSVHGIVEPAFNYLINLYLDDGTGNIRTVFFGTQAKNLLDMENEQVLAFRENPAGFEDKKTEMMGSIVKVVGRVSRNKTFDTSDFVVNQVFTNPDPEEELSKIEGSEKKEKPVKDSDEEVYSLEELEEAVDED